MASAIRRLRVLNGGMQMDSDLEKVAQDARRRILEETALGVRIGLEALSLRLLMVIALLLNAGIFAWCLWEPRWERLVAATVFAVFSYFVVHVKPKE